MTSTPPPDPRPHQVSSLSAREISLLLRTVRGHQDHLNQAHEDARNLLHRGLRPAYVVDFDLLYRYMFERELYPDWSNALDYLVTCTDTPFLIGPGTQLEIDHLLTDLRDTEPAHASATAPSTRRKTPSEVALARLDLLLRRENVHSAATEASEIDQLAYRLAKASLDASRRRASDLPNQADALNWAFVVHRRGQATDDGAGLFPYLLTGTTLLLDEHAIGPRHDVPICRTVQTAIYSQILFRIYSDPVEAMRHTVDMALHTADIEHKLRLSPAYLEPLRFTEDPDWEQVVLEQRVSRELRSQLEALAGYLHDPVLYETQRIYDLTYFAATSQAQLDGTYHAVGETPRRLFDLISAITAALAAADATDSSGLEGLWDTVLSLEFFRQPECITVELVDKVQPRERPPYLAVEMHPPAPNRDLPLYIMRWPSSRDAAGLVSACVEAFQSNGVTDITLTMGTREDVYEFDAEMPITLDEMCHALAEGARGNSGRRASGGPSELTWFRADSADFDIYCDIQSPVPQDALVGLFGERLKELRIAKFYADTSSRYIFSAWLRAALTEIGRELQSDRVFGTHVTDAQDADSPPTRAASPRAR